MNEFRKQPECFKFGQAINFERFCAQDTRAEFHVSLGGGSLHWTDDWWAPDQSFVLYKEWFTTLLDETDSRGFRQLCRPS